MEKTNIVKNWKGNDGYFRADGRWRPLENMTTTLADKKFKVEVPGVGWIWVVSVEDNKEFVAELKSVQCPLDCVTCRFWKERIDELVGDL